MKFLVPLLLAAELPAIVAHPLARLHALLLHLRAPPLLLGRGGPRRQQGGGNRQ